MKDPIDPKFGDWVQRRALTLAEQAQLDEWLTRHPQERLAWAEEARLTGLLRGLPDVPLSSNFTARVLREVDRIPSEGPVVGRGWRWLIELGYGWKAAMAALVLSLAVAIPVHRAGTRAELARSLANVPAAGLAQVELWQDFESISTLPSATEPPLPSVEELAQAIQ